MLFFIIVFEPKFKLNRLEVITDKRSAFDIINPQLSKGGGGQMDHPIGFSDLKFEAFKQWKWNFQYL